MLLPIDGANGADNGDAVRLFDKGRYTLNSYTEVLKDETNRLTIDDVASEKHQADFKRHSDGILNLGISPHTYWLKITLLYPDQYPNVDQRKDWYLEIDKALIGVAELYTHLDDGNYSVDSADLRTDLYSKEVALVSSVFPISIFIGDKTTYYLKLQNSSTALFFSLVLWEPTSFLEKIAIEEFIYGVFFGSMLILLVYNIFVYVSVKVKAIFSM